MSKRIFCLALSTIVLLSGSLQQVAALEDSPASEQQVVSPEETQAGPAEETVISEDQEENSEETADPNEGAAPSTGPCITLNGAVIEGTDSFLHQQTTYTSLRGIVQALRPDAAVTWERDHAVVTAEGLNITVYPNRCYFVANGRYLYLPYGVQLKDGTVYLPIRSLAKALDAAVSWNSATKGIELTSGSGSILPGSEYYNSEDLYWLSHIIYAESGNQSLSGKIGVGNVILNRVSSALFPNTIYGVIFQRNQFTPASSGSINRTPNEESVIAAKLCLDGAVVLSNALWFNRAGLSSWAAKHKSFIATIGAHSFYA